MLSNRGVHLGFYIMIMAFAAMMDPDKCMAAPRVAGDAPGLCRRPKSKHAKFSSAAKIELVKVCL